MVIDDVGFGTKFMTIKLESNRKFWYRVIVFSSLNPKNTKFWCNQTHQQEGIQKQIIESLGKVLTVISSNNPSLCVYESMPA
jgi:hypothetical protein